MSITDLSLVEALAAVEAAEEVQAVRNMAQELDLTFSGNTGIDTLKSKVKAKLESDAQDEKPEEVGLIEPTEQTASSILDTENDEPIEVAKAVVKPAAPEIAELLKMNANEVEDPKLRRLVIRAQALRLRRVAITNNDPSEADLPSVLVTLINKYTGKVSKLIPFGEGSEGGYHIPQMMYDHLKTQKFVLRRKKKSSGMGVPKYTSHFINKYTIQDLPDLTPEELKNLANRQAATQSIG